MSNEIIPFWKIITKILEKFGLNEEMFYIGCGAKNTSVIRCNANSKIDKEKHEYLIQFCESEELVFFCDVRRRIELGASLNLNYDDLQWKDVKELRTKTIGISETQNLESSAVAVMPISYFSYFLKENADMGFNLKISRVPNTLKDDKYYITGKEGKRTKIFTTRYERDPKLREEAIRHHGYTCCGCGFNFMDTYGIKYIEVHHKKPLSTFEGEEPVNPIEDMVCLCSNCHRTVHHDRQQTLSIDELKDRIKQHSKTKEDSK